MVMLDDDDGIFEVTKMFEGSNQAIIIALMKANRRLIKHIEHTLKAGANLGRKTNTLRLTTRECSGRAAEFEIIQTNVFHEANARLDFFENRFSNNALILGEFQIRIQNLKRLIDVHRAHIHNIKVMNRDCEHDRF